jgi:hypothetical protein
MHGICPPLTGRGDGKHNSMICVQPPERPVQLSLIPNSPIRGIGGPAGAA